MPVLTHKLSNCVLKVWALHRFCFIVLAGIKIRLLTALSHQILQQEQFLGTMDHK
eukprot:c54847_g1_i1 orf=34-198(-)